MNRMLFCNCCVEQYLISCQCGKILVTLGTKPVSRCVGFPLRGDGMLVSGDFTLSPQLLGPSTHLAHAKAEGLAVDRCPQVPLPPAPTC